MERKLTDICKIQYGYAFDSAKFSDSEGVPLIRIRDVVRGFSETYTTEDCGEEYFVNDGDMLIGMDGKFNISHWKGGKAYLNQRVCRLLPTNEVDALYLFYFMPKALKAIEDKTPFVTVKHLSAKELNKVVVPVPAMEEQKRIAGGLQKVDELIFLRKKQLAKLDQLVKSRFIELFESKPWETVRAGTIMFNMRNGVSPSNVGAHPAKVLTLSAITQGDFDPDAWKEGMFDTVPPIEKRVTASDFYMCRGNGNKNLVGAGVYSKEDRNDLVFPDTAIAATVDLQRVCLPYLFHAWKRPSVREQIEMGARTTNGTFKINQGVVSNIELILPPLELQKRFAAFVEQTDKLKLTIQQSLDKLELLKKSLMQKYFG